MSHKKRALWLATRDLRLSDNPALIKIAALYDVTCLFVLDERLLRSSQVGMNRLSFLLESLVDLRKSLREIGSELFFRQGHYEREVLLVVKETQAEEVHILNDFSGYAKSRYERLYELLKLEGVSLIGHPGTSIIEPGLLCPKAGGSHFKIFTPYYRVWENTDRRDLYPRIDRLDTTFDKDPGNIPDVEELKRQVKTFLKNNGRPSDTALYKERCKFLLHISPDRDRGGEQKAHETLNQFISSKALFSYGQSSNDLGSAGTSRLSSYLHFGCISPLEVEKAVIRAYLDLDNPFLSGGIPKDKISAMDPDVYNIYKTKNDISAEPESDDAALSVASFIRQLCWRDFYLQFAAAFPDIQKADYRPRAIGWIDDEAQLLSWMNGESGEEIVDAAMAQLIREGFVHNRARLIASSYLTKTLRIDWRYGLSHYNCLLTDADYASNAGNWQWMAGTGTDTRPNRTLNPKRQQERFDPNGTYRTRYLRHSLNSKPSPLPPQTGKKYQQKLF